MTNGVLWFCGGLYVAKAWSEFVDHLHRVRGRAGLLVLALLCAVWPLTVVVGAVLALPAWFRAEWIGDLNDVSSWWRGQCAVCGEGRRSHWHWLLEAKAWAHVWRSPSCRRDGLSLGKLVVERILHRRIWSKKRVEPAP